MARHPAPDLIEAQIIDHNGDARGTEEERLFAKFAADAKDAEITPQFSVWMLEMDPRTRKPRSSQQGAFLFDAPMDTYDSFTEICSYIRDQYGAGFYRVTGRMMVAGAERIGFNKVVHVIEPRAQKTGVTTNAPVDNQLQVVLQAMQRQAAESAARFDRLLETMMQQRPAERAVSAFDPQQMMQWATLAGTLLTSLKGLFSPPTTQNNMLETLAIIKGVRDFTTDIAGDKEGGESNDSDVLKEAIKTFGKPLALMLMARQQQAQQAPPKLMPPMAPMVANPAPAVAPLPVTPTAPSIEMQSQEGTQMDALTKELKKQVDQLLMFAGSGMSAGSVANLVVANASDEQISQLAQVLEQPNCVDEIVQLVPRANSQRTWLEEFRTAVLEQIEPVDVEGEDEIEASPDVPATDSD